MAIQRRSAIALASAGALGCVLATAGAAQAAPLSTSVAGYASYPGTYTSVSAAWVEPQTACTSPTSSVSFWVGLDGAVSPTAEQSGTEVLCTGGVPKHYAWYDVYPAPVVLLPGPVTPGDQIYSSVTYSGGTNFTLSITDATKGWTSTVVKSAPGAARSSAEILVEGPGAAGSLADFGTITFTSCMINGAPLAAAVPPPVAINMMLGTILQAKTSPLLSPTSFQVTWIHA